MKTRSVLLILALALLAAAPAFAGGDYREEFSKTVAFKAGDAFTLENVNGRVEVSTWKQDQVEIKAEKVARDDEKDLKDVEIRVEESAGAVTVRAIWPRDRRHFNVSVDFTVRVPEGAVLRAVETVNGDVRATGVFGSASLETTNGEVTATGVQGALRAETTNGQIRLSDIRGRVEADNTNGGIEIERLSFRDGIKAETVNGSIRIAIDNPDQVNADLRVETVNGHISVDVPMTLKNLRKTRHELEAQVGTGGAEISLSTTNGSVTIGR